MRVEIANLVFPVLRRALQTQQRLAAGHPAPCEAELAAFKALLLTEREAQAIPDFGADQSLTAPRFLGIRYALACWLDETLGRQPAWAHAWTAQGLEAALFGTQNGSGAFWDQADLALERSDADACEAFFMCVHLGFRGSRRGSREQVAAWVKSAKARLAEDLSISWPAPPALEVAAQAPPLRQRERLQRTLLAVSVPLSVLAPLAAWLLARRFGW